VTPTIILYQKAMIKFFVDKTYKILVLEIDAGENQTKDLKI
jgi:hypothetical protein